MQFQKLDGGSLPVKKGRLIKTLSDSTIKGIMDAIVELVTNSDDSYKRAEQDGIDICGRIDIFLSRAHGGHCKEVKVIDEAMGIDHLSLKNAIEFSSETSGFKEGRNVRGFFGRGLKESIIALGKGEIFTLHNGVLSRAIIYYNEDKKDAEYELSIPIQNLSNDQIVEYGFTGKSGTVVKIEVTNERKDRIPSMRSIEEQIQNLASLREINSSSKRNVYLHFVELDSKRKDSFVSPIKYKEPNGKSVFEEDREIMGSITHFKILESVDQLTSPKLPYGKAGLLIKAESAILDNQLFGFETDPNGLFFYGEIVCPGISEAIRNGDESVVDYNRGGLDWRHPYNQEIERVSKEIIQKLIADRRERLNLEKHTEVKEPINRILDKLCKKLSDLAKSEIEEKSPGRGEVENFIIKPIFANIVPDEPRAFSVYTPVYLVEDQGTKLVKLSSSNNEIIVSNPEIKLESYEKDENILKGTFKVMGSIKGQTSIITALLGDLTATSEVRIGDQGKRGDSTEKGSGGLFKKIVPALDEEPIQRFEYSEGGTIKIYTKFPGIQGLLGEKFEKITNPEGKIVLAEILIEAFCRHLAYRRKGRYFDDEVDPYNADMDRLRRSVSLTMYQLLSDIDSSELIDK